MNEYQMMKRGCDRRNGNKLYDDRSLQWKNFIRSEGAGRRLYFDREIDDGCQ